MAVEIERKFLVVGDGWRELVEDSQVFTQGYLAAGESCLVRVRAGQGAAWLTLKGRDQQQLDSSEGVLQRTEFEYEIPVADAQEMLTQLAYAALEKTRFFLNSKQYAWTVDVFAGRHTGLVLLEIEGDGVESLTAADLPDWVGAEVSSDPQYANANLAKQ